MRLSVSDIDTYRRYLDGDEDMSLKDVLAWLRRTAPRPAYLDAGNAFHKILERSDVGELERVSLDGFAFRFNLDARIALPRIREMKGELEILTSVGPVTLVGKVDGIEGSVHDFKLAGWFNPEKYLSSYQWRCYLLMFDAWKFVYDVFVYDEKEIKEGRGKEKRVIGTEYVVKELHELPLYAYPDMERDVLREVDHFARFVAEHMPEKLESSAYWQGEPRLVSKAVTLARAA